MKRILTLTILSMFLIGLVPAQEIATQEDIDVAGITPDQPFLWGLDRAIERITEMFSEKEKLRHAKERLAEVKVMIQENKIEEAEKGRQSFNKLRLRVRNQTQIQEHIELMDNLGQKISAIASVKGKLTEGQRNEIKNLILQHKERIREEAEEMMNESNVCCKITVVYPGAEPTYGWQTRSYCSLIQDGKPLIGASRIIVNNSYCERK